MVEVHNGQHCRAHAFAGDSNNFKDLYKKKKKYYEGLYACNEIEGFFCFFQMKIFNRNFPCMERIEYMGWVNEKTSESLPWLTYKPKFLTLKGMDMLMFDSPPVSTCL